MNLLEPRSRTPEKNRRSKMTLITTIRDADIGADFHAPPTYKKRQAARVVLFDKEGRVALIAVQPPEAVPAPVRSNRRPCSGGEYARNRRRRREKHRDGSSALLLLSVRPSSDTFSRMQHQPRIPNRGSGCFQAACTILPTPIINNFLSFHLECTHNGRNNSRIATRDFQREKSYES